MSSSRQRKVQRVQEGVEPHQLGDLSRADVKVFRGALHQTRIFLLICNIYYFAAVSSTFKHCRPVHPPLFLRVLRGCKRVGSRCFNGQKRRIQPQPGQDAPPFHIDKFGELNYGKTLQLAVHLVQFSALKVKVCNYHY